MKKIYITGVSGTGKSTINKELDKRGIFNISIDAVKGLCSWQNKQTGEKVEYHFDGDAAWFEKYDWTCDIEQLKKLMNVNKELVVVTGIAGNQNNYLPLFDKIFLLQCRQKTFIKRLVERKTDNLFGKNPTEQEFLINFYQGFEKDLISRGQSKLMQSNQLIQLLIVF